MEKIKCNYCGGSRYKKYQRASKDTGDSLVCYAEK